MRRNIKIVIFNKKILNRRGKRYNPIAEQDEEIAHFKVHIFRKNHNFIKNSALSEFGGGSRLDFGHIHSSTKETFGT